MKTTVVFSKFYMFSLNKQFFPYFVMETLHCSGVELPIVFLDASSHLYIRSCPSVRRMDGRSVTRFFLNAENERFSS